MTKTALFITGSTRLWRENHELIRWIQEHQVDTFASVSSLPEEELVEFAKTFRVKRLHVHRLDLPGLVPAGTTEEYMTSHKKIETSLYNSLSMFYCHRKNVELLLAHEQETDRRYDFIAYIRTDGDFRQAPIPYPADRLAENTVYIPLGYDYDGINDQMALGNREPMITYCTVYEHIVEYLDRGIIYNPEVFVLANLHFQKVNVLRFEYPYTLRKERHAA